MTTDITELTQNLKAAAEKWQEAWGKYDKVEITIAEFIRAANQYESIVKDPANVIELVEALEKAQAGEKQWREVVDAFCSDDADWHKLTNSNNELIALLSQVLCKQADRIAELESRTVTVKPMRPGHITVGGEKIGIYMRDEVDEFIAALTAAGIKVEAE